MTTREIGRNGEEGEQAAKEGVIGNGGEKRLSSYTKATTHSYLGPPLHEVKGIVEPNAANISRALNGNCLTSYSFSHKKVLWSYNLTM